MKHRVSTLALSAAAFGAGAFLTSSVVLAQSEKTTTVNTDVKTEAASPIAKSSKSKAGKSAKESGKNAISSASDSSINKPKGKNLFDYLSVFPTDNPDGTAINRGFRPDFDGAGGRGPAMVRDEGTNKDGYYVKTRGYRLEPEPDVAIYARQADKTYKDLKGIDWLNIGLDSRVRFENRVNDYRPYTDSNIYTPGTTPNTKAIRAYPQSVWYQRTRGYIGVKDILDPLRVTVEFQDSRQYNSIYELQGQEVNQTELIQGYGELYFKDALGKDAKGQGRPISIRAGRMAFELGSRRLIARNEFRNTTNSFEGVRLKLGQRENDFDIDSFVMRPVIRYPYAWDQPDWQNWIYGSYFTIHEFSDVVTIQPYFIGRHQYGDPTNISSSAKLKRDTQAPGLRLYGVLGNFDYDLDLMKQFGTVAEVQQLGPYSNWLNVSKPYGGVNRTVQHDAIAYAGDIGYTFSDHPWKPRISAVYIYGSGNKSPYDGVNQNVDTFYGFNQPFSRDDYETWSNMKDPKVRLEFNPTETTQVDTAFSAYWLASSAAGWDRAGLIAPLGNRGTFMGTELDMRIRQKVSQFWNISASYARFWPGSFTSSFAPPVAQQWPPTTWPGGTVTGQTGTTYGLTGRPTDFIYLEANANAFGDGKSISEIPGTQFVAYWDEDEKQKKLPSWNGFYVGLNAGGSLSHSNMTIETLAAGGGATTTYPRSNTIATTDLNLFPTTYNQKLNGFVGGIQFGANWNIAKTFVVGLEGDLDGTAGNTDTKSALYSKQNGPYNAKTGLPTGSLYTTYSQHTASLNYLGTGRGRLGYLVTPTLLAYGTAGFAYGGVTAANSYVTVANATANSPVVYGPQFVGVLTGWTAGGGLEWAISPEWSVKADYLYYNLGKAGASTANSNLIFSPFVPISAANYSSSGWGSFSNSSSSFSGNVIRAGVNRHFDLASSDSVNKKEPESTVAISAAISGSLTKKSSGDARVVNWQGAYAGINAGGIWANANAINNIANYSYNAAPQYVSSSAWLSGSVPSSGTAAFLGGGQIGYNLELSKLWKLKFVAGLETDIQGVAPGGTKGSNSFVTTLTPGGGYNQALISRSATNSLTYIGTARGRFGFTLIPSIFLYGTGGLAYGQVNSNLQTFSGLGLIGGWQGGASSSSATQLGWTAGGGTEWQFKDNWSVKGEYLYYDLGQLSGSVQNWAYQNNQNPNPGSFNNYAVRFSGNILRAGVNYHLNWGKSGPVVAQY